MTIGLKCKFTGMDRLEIYLARTLTITVGSIISMFITFIINYRNTSFFASNTRLGIGIALISLIIFFILTLWYAVKLSNKHAVKIKEDLFASEERWKLLVNSVQDYAIFMVSVDGHVLSWNEGAANIKGYNESEITGAHISIFYSKDESSFGEATRNLDIARDAGYFKGEGWRIRKDGSRFWADIVITPMYDQGNLLKSFVKITRDVTIRKNAQEKILYQSRLIEDISDAIFSVTPSFQILTWNKAAEYLYGYKKEEVVGMSAISILKSPLNEDIKIGIRRTLKQKGYWKGEVIHLNKSGSPVTLLLSASATRDAQGEQDGYVIVCRDISERKYMEEELRNFNQELNERVNKKTAELSSVFERVSDGFIALDKQGRIAYLNTKAASLNHGNVEDFIGRSIWDTLFKTNENIFKDNFFESFACQEIKHFEVHAGSSQAWLECDMYPSPDGISLFVRDITEQQLTRRMINQSNIELRALASHLQDIREDERAGIAREIHDELGQQLTGLKMDLSWIAKKIVSYEFANLHQKIKSTILLLDNTISTVRRIATELRPSILDDLGLVAAIEWQSLEFEKRSGILTFFHPDINELIFPPSISIGLFRICQECLTNVARHSGAQNVYIRLNLIEDFISLSVIDDGKGFNKLDLSGENKTLGLLGMKERALMMQGKLEIISEPGKGTTLSVEVPLPSFIN